MAARTRAQHLGCGFRFAMCPYAASASSSANATVPIRVIVVAPIRTRGAHQDEQRPERGAVYSR